MASENTVLAEAVRNYPCLYDKSSDDFKDTNKKKLCWKDVAEAVGVSTGKRTLFSCLHVFVLVVFFVCGAAMAAGEVSSSSAILKT